MVRDVEFVKAAASLVLMDDESLAMAAFTCRMGHEAAMKTKSAKNKAIAIEMIAMLGEAIKEMARRMARDNNGMVSTMDGQPDMNLEDSIAKVDRDTDADIAELEAA